MAENKVYEPIPVPAEPPPGFWQRETVYHPEPIMPIHHSVFMAPCNAACKHAFSEFSYPAETMSNLDIGGWGYVGTVRFGPDDLRLPARIRGCIENVRNCKELQSVQLWYTDWKPTQEARIAELQRIDTSSLSDDGLANHVSSVLTPFL